LHSFFFFNYFYFFFIKKVRNLEFESSPWEHSSGGRRWNTYFILVWQLGRGNSVEFKFPHLYDLAMNKECTLDEMWRLGWTDGSRGWVWRRHLLAWEEESVRECYVLLHNGLQDNVHDTWRWLLDPVHGYSVREAYRSLLIMVFQWIGLWLMTSDISLSPQKVSLFVWCLLRNKLPTKENLVRRWVLQLTESACVSRWTQKR